MKARAAVYVRLKPGLLDPQGATIAHALTDMGYPGVSGMRVGKWITFDLEGEDADDARAKVGEMCDRLLANPVIEEYRFEVHAGEVHGNGDGA